MLGFGSRDKAAAPGGVEMLDDRLDDAKDAVKESLWPVLKNMVNEPAKLRLEVTATQTTIMATVYPAKDDVGYLIGRRGQNAQALRQIMVSITGKHKVGFVLEIVG